MTKDPELVERVVRDPEDAGLDERQLAIVRYAIKLTRTPAEMVRADVEALRAVGLEDRDVLAVCEVVSYYAYANRIVDGLGVELED